MQDKETTKEGFLSIGFFVQRQAPKAQLGENSLSGASYLCEDVLVIEVFVFIGRLRSG
jgi:hypothetical protein